MGCGLGISTDSSPSQYLTHRAAYRADLPN
jgi:hypothetical protein